MGALHTHVKKILTRGELIAHRRIRGECGERVVLTNGCFDILHRGHTEMLRGARALGDCLMVGLNSDQSVRLLKGAGRPVNDQVCRLHQLAKLECVSHICVFDEQSVKNLVAEIKPDVLVKGGDYVPRDVVGREIVESYGGSIIVLPFLAGYSTTGLVGQ